jgi:outer membrane receptor protein involved in Fe transport
MSMQYFMKAHTLALPLGLIAPVLAAAQTATQDEILVYGRQIEQVGTATSGSQGVVGYADFEARPISRVGELAENVPGLIATQHSGTGKANQYFLRGFNLDHGTDLAGYVDDAPVNMRSHGHGQGYLDLNFLIPEMVERIDYTKGPYHARNGDFASAGSMTFTTKSKIDSPFAELTGGSFGYWRRLAAGGFDAGPGTVLAAAEATASNGPWVLDEDLRKVNTLLKYSAADWSLGFSGYASRWTSTDQVPERAIASGLLPYRGFVDPDLGGRSKRFALTVGARLTGTEISVYAIASRLRLTSNFTYLLDDPADGDEFRQLDRRVVFGGSLGHEIVTGAVSWRFGGDGRFDRIGKLGLYRTSAGRVVATVREDRVDEYGGGMFGETKIALSAALRLMLGVRADAIGYRVQSDLAANSGSGSDAIFTPKAALAWKPAEGVEFYANYGEGYHSNDVRGAVIAVDPTSGGPAERVPIFARSRGAELGARVERGTLTASAVGFWLDLASELVFVGDAGTTEPNDASRRFGTELSLFWKAAPWITADGTLAFTRARFRRVPGGGDRIPGTPPIVAAGGVSMRFGPAITATLRLRHFASAPLVEDGSQRSRATTLANLGAYWENGPLRIAADVLNLMDARDPDISYYYASRLPGEPAEGIADRHIHPIEPRQIRLTTRFRF